MRKGRTRLPEVEAGLVERLEDSGVALARRFDAKVEVGVGLEGDRSASCEKDLDGFDLVLCDGVPAQMSEKKRRKEVLERLCDPLSPTGIERRETRG